MKPGGRDLWGTDTHGVGKQGVETRKATEDERGVQGPGRQAAALGLDPKVKPQAFSSCRSLWQLQRLFPNTWWCVCTFKKIKGLCQRVTRCLYGPLFK